MKPYHIEILNSWLTLEENTLLEYGLIGMTQIRIIIKDTLEIRYNEL